MERNAYACHGLSPMGKLVRATEKWKVFIALVCFCFGATPVSELRDFSWLMWGTIYDVGDRAEVDSMQGLLPIYTISGSQLLIFKIRISPFPFCVCCCNVWGHTQVLRKMEWQWLESHSALGLCQGSYLRPHSCKA